MFNSNEEKLLAILNASEKKSAGNKSLVKTLGITEEEYNTLKNDLIQRNVVKSGKGRGGSLVLVVDNKEIVE